MTHTHKNSLLPDVQAYIGLNYPSSALHMQTHQNPDVYPQRQPTPHLKTGSDTKLSRWGSGEVDCSEYKLRPWCRRSAQGLLIEAHVRESPLLKDLGWLGFQAEKTEKRPGPKIRRGVNTNNEWSLVMKDMQIRKWWNSIFLYQISKLCKDGWVWW